VLAQPPAIRRDASRLSAAAQVEPNGQKRPTLRA